MIPNDNYDGYIVVMEKNLSNINDLFTQQREIKKFKSNEKQVFIETIDMVIREILKQFGIIPFDTSESALNSAFDTLNRNYDKTIEIIDRYKDTKETIIDRQELITIIMENDILSCANEIRVKEI